MKLKNVWFIPIIFFIIISLVIFGPYLLKNVNENNIEDKTLKFKQENKMSEQDLGTFVPEPTPELVTESIITNAPVYLYLFTHTEDHINHELSEERYLRLAPTVSSMNSLYPESNIVWNIFFQGSDALTVLERNEDTGVVDMLQEYANEGVITFAYHGVHEPVTLQKPEKTLGENPSWTDIVNSINNWTTCQRDPVFGGCIENSGGGIQAVQQIGQVDSVSGVGIVLGLLETGAGKHAIDKNVNNRLLGFGFSDHAPAGPGYNDIVKELTTILSPAVDTTPTLFWMDDVIRTNDAGLYLTGSLDLKNDPMITSKVLESVDRTRPNIYHAGFASKYIYTMKGTSPTNYAYANPLNPELPESMINEENTIERYYQNSIDNLEYLAGDYMQNTNTQFISSNEIKELVAPAEYWEITDEQLDVLARWTLTKTDNGQLPNFVSDGTEYYSLRDTLILLSSALTNPNEHVIELQLGYGPLESVSVQRPVKVETEEMIEIANYINGNINSGYTAEWQTVPLNIVESSYTLNSGDKINTAQLLYALAAVYASNYAGEPLDSFTVPMLEPMPATLLHLEGLECTSCEGSSWSLKPARIPQ